LLQPPVEPPSGGFPRNEPGFPVIAPTGAGESLSEALNAHTVKGKRRSHTGILIIASMFPIAILHHELAGRRSFNAAGDHWFRAIVVRQLW
jgi:hypothetical protein